MKTVILFISILLYSSLYAKDEVLYQKNDYIFTEKNFDELVIMGEFIARSAFSKEDKKNLKSWSIKDFKSTPKKSMVFYNFMHSDVIPYIINKTARATYATELYENIIEIFRKAPDNSPYNLLAIIEKYNPPIKELYLMRERRFKLLQQTLLINQQNFNMTINMQQQSNNILINAIKDHSLQQTISIEGGTIIQEFNDYILVKGADGKEYRVNK